MKWRKLTALVLVVVVALFPAIAFADSPEPWTYAATKCASMPHVVLLSALQDYTTQYGLDHNLPDGKAPGAMFAWQAAHAAIVNGFLSSVGCSPALNDDSTALTFWYKIYVPTYQRAYLHTIPD